MLKKTLTNLYAAGKKSPARIYSFAAIFAVYISKKVPDLPIEATILFVATLFGLGEGVQRVENKKTEIAFHTCCCSKEGVCPVCNN